MKMPNRPPQPSQQRQRSSVTTTNSKSRPEFINTLEHRRFAEFCDACRRYGYIGLCYGPSGVGKTLSAKRYSRWDEFKAADRWRDDSREHPGLDTVFYTPSVINSPGRIEADVNRSREKLRDLARRPVRLEAAGRLESIRRRDKQHAEKVLDAHDWFSEPIPELQPTYGKVAMEYAEKESRIDDPTSLIVIDEADRLRMASLEQVRAIFDAQEIGLILIGMPGLEKRLARYPQFYSRIGFVHEFRPLGAPEIRQLLGRYWAPAGVKLPQTPLDPETVAVIIRVTGGNFRLLNRLLTQIQRILEINTLAKITKAVVEAARESLVIGQV
jgi:DNA transposition AAA+ family ATPase